MCIYSRNSEDNTGKYPDIVASIGQLVKPGVKGLVLDCEAVAYDRKLGKLLPFQVSFDSLSFFHIRVIPFSQVTNGMSWLVRHFLFLMSTLSGVGLSLVSVSLRRMQSL